MSQGPSLGIDIGGTKTHGVLLDASGRVLADQVRPTRKGADGVLSTARAVADDCLREAAVDRSQLAGVGVGIPGQVDHLTGVVRTAVNLGIDHLELGALLSADLGVDVRVDNDVKAAARGAAQALDVQGADLTYVNIGTGVAAATLVAGRVVRGEGNLAGEIGHVPVVPDGERCACGQRGCLEALVGGGRIAARLALIDPPLALPTLVAQATRGRLEAIAELDRIAGGIATAVQLVVLTQGSARVVLGGGVIHATPGLVDHVRRMLELRAAESDFLASLHLPGRVVVLPSGYPVAAIGAALVGRAGSGAARPAPVG